MQHLQDHEYSDDCEGCQPALLDVKTGKPMPADSPVMVAVLKAWKEKTTYAERRTTTRVWIGQSKDPADIAIMQRVGGIIQEAMKDADQISGSNEQQT